MTHGVKGQGQTAEQPYSFYLFIAFKSNNKRNSIFGKRLSKTGMII